MILSARPRPQAPTGSVIHKQVVVPLRNSTGPRPVLQHTRMPQQLCLDLQPRLR